MKILKLIIQLLHQSDRIQFTFQRLFIILSVILFTNICIAQTEKPALTLFESNRSLPLKFTYSNKQVKKDTDKKNGIKTDLIYDSSGTWATLPITIRARGNFRRENCYFPPLKMYLKKENTKGTIFKGHKRLKVVLPCLLQNRSNDDVVKEFLAYKMYEVLSPIHFRTRLVHMDYLDARGEKSEIHPLTFFLPDDKINTIYDAENEEVFAFRKSKKYQLKAILIEDDKKVAKRNDAKVMDRFVHPLAQDAMAATRNAFFQFMIANTDFSTAYSHNQKLIFKQGKTIPLPYDFDMSGLVNASYAVVSNINNQNLPITDVTQRMYRGFNRDINIMQEVRLEFLQKKEELLKLIDDYQQLFDNQKTLEKTKDFVVEFFTILENDKTFKTEILDRARTR